MKCRSENLKKTFKTCALDLKYLKSCKRKEGEEEEEIGRRKELQGRKIEENL